MVGYLWFLGNGMLGVKSKGDWVVVGRLVGIDIFLFWG